MKHTEVLVVGAGPVGMLAAVLLRQAGIRVRIIDQEQRTTTHSYACALHPGTLKLLAEWEVYYDLLMSQGQRISTVGIYDKTTRRAELDLDRLDNNFRYALVLAQNDFEKAIERKLADEGVEVEWGYRLAEISENHDKTTARIDHLRESGKGYAVPTLDWEVVKSFDLTADFVIGADGHHSHLRECLGIGLVPNGSPRTFGIFEFQTDAPPVNEMHVVMQDGSNVLWPMPRNRCRWTLELSSEEVEEFPVKERSRFVGEDITREQETRATLRKLLNERAPWFKGQINEMDWAPRVQFEPSLAERFGAGRCWLVGDAAHQTGPVGVQSMNIGLREAADLVNRVARVFRGEASLHLLEEFGHERRDEWQQLLSPDSVKARSQVDHWIAEHAQQFLSCIPASGTELSQLLDQLQIDLQPQAEVHGSKIVF